MFCLATSNPVLSCCEEATCRQQRYACTAALSAMCWPGRLGLCSPLLRASVDSSTSSLEKLCYNAMKRLHAASKAPPARLPCLLCVGLAGLGCALLRASMSTSPLSRQAVTPCIASIHSCWSSSSSACNQSKSMLSCKVWVGRSSKSDRPV